MTWAGANALAEGLRDRGIIYKMKMGELYWLSQIVIDAALAVESELEPKK